MVNVIDKIKIFEPLILKNKKGDVLRMLRKTDKLFTNISEIYFSEIKPRQIKAWKKQKFKSQIISVPVGLIKLVIYDDKKNLFTEVILGRNSHKLIKIPPKLWYGFKSLSNKKSLIVNCTNKVHKDSDTYSSDFKLNKIPFKW